MAIINNITRYEAQFLRGMVQNSFSNLLEGYENFKDCSCEWLFAIVDECDFTEKQSTGVVSSLVQKGLIHSEWQEGDKLNTVGFTEKGYKLVKELGMERLENIINGNNINKINNKEVKENNKMSTKKTGNKVDNKEVNKEETVSLKELLVLLESKGKEVKSNDLSRARRILRKEEDIKNLRLEGKWVFDSKNKELLLKQLPELLEVKKVQ